MTTRVILRFVNLRALERTSRGLLAAVLDRKDIPATSHEPTMFADPPLISEHAGHTLHLHHRDLFFSSIKKIHERVRTGTLKNKRQALGGKRESMGDVCCSTHAAKSLCQGASCVLLTSGTQVLLIK